MLVSLETAEASVWGLEKAVDALDFALWPLCLLLVKFAADFAKTLVDRRCDTIDGAFDTWLLVSEGRPFTVALG